MTETNQCIVRHIDHVGIAVQNIEAALRLYQRLLDAPETPVIEEPRLGLRAALITQGQTRIELLQSTDPNNAIGRFIAQRGEGLHHIAFHVDDIEAKLAQLKEMGVRLVDEHPREGITGRIAFLHPSAMMHVLVELVQPPEGRQEPQ